MKPKTAYYQILWASETMNHIMSKCSRINLCTAAYIFDNATDSLKHEYKKSHKNGEIILFIMYALICKQGRRRGVGNWTNNEIVLFSCKRIGNTNIWFFIFNSTIEKSHIFKSRWINKTTMENDHRIGSRLPDPTSTGCTLKSQQSYCGLGTFYSRYNTFMKATKK